MFFGLEYVKGSRLFKNHQVIHKYLHYDGSISVCRERERHQEKLQGLQRMKKLRLHICEE